VSKPDWLEVGSPVAVCEVGGRVCRVVTVERFTKTRVVLSDGEWFPLDRLEKRWGSSWSPSLRLEDVAEPSVVQRLRVQQAMGLSSALDRMVRSLPLRATEDQMAEARTLAIKLARKLGAA
jgi:hypothetical protein